MTISVRSIALQLSVACLALCLQGCGSDEPPARDDILKTPPAELYGTSTKSMIYEFRANVRKHGVAGAREHLPQMLENFQGYEQLPVGEHMETYKQIDEKLKSLETTLAASPADEQVKQAAEEIGTLADKLPGKANEDPQVE